MRSAIYDYLAFAGTQKIPSSEYSRDLTQNPIPVLSIPPISLEIYRERKRYPFYSENPKVLYYRFLLIKFSDHQKKGRSERQLPSGLVAFF